MINNAIVIDTDNYLGHFPFRKLVNNTAIGLAKVAESNNVDVLCAASLNAIFYRNVMDGNMELYEEIKAYEKSAQSPVKYKMFAVINPSYICYEKDIETAYKLGFAGIELCPLYHNYSLTSANCIAAVKMAASYKMPVRIRDGLEDMRERHWMDVQKNVTGAEVTALIQAVPEATYILTGFYPSPAMIFKNLTETILPTKKDIFFSTFKLDPYVAGKPFDVYMEKIGVDHTVLGSGACVAYMEPQLLRLIYAKDFTDAELAKIYGGNIKPYLGL